MTFCFVADPVDHFVNDSESSASFDFGREFYTVSSSQRIRVLSTPVVHIEISTPRHLSQLEADAMERAFWRSVSVLDDGAEG
jgi:hypothetical protein